MGFACTSCIWRRPWHWIICGRRGGKSLVLALIAVYLATFYDWSAYLSPGERGTIMVIAPDRNYDRLSGKLGNVLEQQAYVTQAGPALLQQRLDTLKTQPPASDPQQRAAQQRQIDVLELRIKQEQEIRPTPPNVTFSQRMTLHAASAKSSCSTLAGDTPTLTCSCICRRKKSSARAI